MFPKISIIILLALSMTSAVQGSNQYSLSGEITYYTRTSLPIAYATLVLSGAAKYTTTSDENGKYTLNNIEPGNYTLVAMNPDQLDGLSANDAIQIRRYKVQDNVSFNCYQMLAADVSLNGTVSSLDASRVDIGSAKLDANLETCLQDDSCTHWIFVKPDITDCNDWPPINNADGIQINIDSDISDMNIVGIRLGDVTGDWNPHPLTMTNSLGMTFKYIPAGTFLMGSPSNELGRKSTEAQHTVTISKPFYMQTTEVTQGQWKLVMNNNNPSSFSNCGDNCPVENISWNDTLAFIEALNAMGEGTYSLPTEAQWEYAARAGVKTAYINGDISNTMTDANLGQVGWYNSNSSSATHPVAQKPPNAWGLYDIHGNVYEWCQDWYGGYPGGPVTDPLGPTSGTLKICRGGAWFGDAQDCRLASRGNPPPDLRRNDFGLRLLKSP